MSTGTGNALILFNDGEEIEETDFNALQNALTLRAWEVPGFADMVAFDQFGSNYDAVFIGADGRNGGVFTKGGGLLPTASGPISTLHPGMLGIWNRPGYGIPDSDPLAARSVRWFYLATSWAYTHDATSGGYRYDLVSCASTEAAGVPTARPFQDGTTGIATSVTVNKETVLTLDLATSPTVTKGGEAGSAAAAQIPALPSGRNLLYYVLLHGSAITNVYDCTIPVGPLITAIAYPAFSHYDTWPTEEGAIAASASGTAILVPPSSFAGDPSVRILGFTMCAGLLPGDTVRMVALAGKGGTTTNIGGDLSTLFTRDSSLYVTTIDLRGLPCGAGALPAVAGNGPLWANGRNDKAPSISDVTNILSSIAIAVTAAGGGTTIEAVTWYAIRG